MKNVKKHVVVERITCEKLKAHVCDGVVVLLVVVAKVVHEGGVVEDKGLGQFLLGLVVFHDSLDEDVVPRLPHLLPTNRVVQHHRVRKVGSLRVTL